MADVNEGPTDLALDNASVAENAEGAVVGTLSSFDPDAGDTVEYTVSDDRFEVVDGELRLAEGVSLNHEEVESIDVTVTATDSEGLSTSEDFTIDVTDVNEAPTDLTLTRETSTADADFSAGDGHNGASVQNLGLESDQIVFTMSFTTGDDVDAVQTLFETGGSVYGTNVVINDGMLEIYAGEGNDLELSVPIEAGTNYSIALELDTEGDTIKLLMSDELPLSEMTESNSLVASHDDFTDRDYTGTDRMAVGDDSGSAQGRLGGDFQGTIEGPGLEIYSDSTFDDVFVEAGVAENTEGAVVGTLSAFDPDAGDSLTFTVSDDRFEVVDGELRLAEGVTLDHEAEPAIDLTVTATDEGGLATSESFTVDVVDLNEGPTDLSLDGNTIDENSTEGVVGTVSVTDPDVGDTHTFSLVDNEGQPFAIDAETGEISLVSPEIPEGSILHIDASDAGGLSFGDSVSSIQDLSGENTAISQSDASDQPTLIEDGPFGSPGLSFDGENDRLDIADDSAINLSSQSERSFALTIKTGDDVDTRQIVYEEGGTVNGFNFYIDDGQLYMGAWSESTGWEFQSVSVDVEPGESYSIAAVYDGADGTFTGYVNGENIGSVEVGDTMSAHSGNIGLGGIAQHTVFHDGASGANEGFYFEGSIGEFVAYNDALDSSEVAGIDMEMRGIDPVVDFETQDSYELTVQVTDSGGETYQETVTINVNDLNEGPVDLELDGSSVAENDAGAVIGTLSSFDPDAGDSVTYSVSDDRFEVVDGELRLADDVSLNHEEAASIDVAVTATDSEGLSTTETFTVDVADVNEGPSDLALDNASVAENAEGAVVGTLSSFDPDAGDTIEYTVSDDRFEVVDGELRLAEGVSLDHEEADSLDVTVTATDSEGLFTSEDFTIEVADVNEAPTDLELEAAPDAFLEQGGLLVIEAENYDSAAEGSGHAWGASDTDGMVHVDDGANAYNAWVDEASVENDSPELTYSIHIDTPGTYYVHVLGAAEDGPRGNADSVHIGIDGDRITDNGGLTGFGSSPQWGSQDTYTREAVEVTFDSAGTHELNLWAREDGVSVDQIVLTTDRDFNPSAQPLTESPRMSDMGVFENDAGAVVGTLSSFDPDAGDSVTYSVSDDRFEVVDGELRLAEGESLNHEEAATLNIEVTATDSGGLSTSETFEINVADVNEAPTDLALDNSSVAENDAGAVVGTLSSFDPDADDSVSYTVSDDRFEVVDGELRLAEDVSLNHEEAESIQVTVTATDSEGLSTSEEFSIDVADVNEAPSDLTLSTDEGVLSLNQNGDGDDLAISSNVTDFPSDAITVEVTFTADGMPEGSGAPLFSYADSNSGGGNDVLIWGENSSGNLAIFLDGQRFPTDISNSDLFDGEEHTVSFTWDDASGELNVFVDGDLEYTRDVNVSGIDSDGTITLGQEQDSEGGSFDSGQIFQGEIAEVRIYDEALTEEQVAENAAGEITQDGLVTHWDMAEAENGVVSDLAGNNDLVLENGAEIASVAGDAAPSIAENVEGATVGTLSSVDPDDGDTVTYSVSDDRFEVVDGELRVKEGESLDHESAESLDITVTATDASGLSTSETFSIDVTDVNEAPTEITLETSSENLITGGSFETQDVRTGGWRGFGEDTSGNWDTANGIEIWDNLGGTAAADGNQFVELDYTSAADAISQTVTTEQGQTYNLSLDVRARGSNTTDTIEIYWNGELVDAVDPSSTTWETVTFDVVGTGGDDVLEFREAVGESDGLGAHLDNVTLIEVPLTIVEGAEGASLGNLSVVDPDADDTVSFSVDDDRFEVVDGELRLTEDASLDYEAEQSVDVTVTATDSDGLETSETFTINVADVDDTPVVTMSQKTVTETAEVDNADITTSNGGGSETSTVNLSDAVDGSSEIVIDFGRIDNSFEIEVNGQPIADEVIQLQPNVFDDASEVMLVFEDGTVASTPWVPNSDGSPRFQVVISDDGVEVLGTRGPNSGDMEPMTLEGAEFNTVDLLEGDNSVTVINPDGDGPDGLDATVSAEFDTVVDVQTVTGTDSDDTLVASDADDVLIGGEGDDLFIFDGGSGADTVDGGAGWTDTLDLSAATDNGMVYGDDWTVTLTEGEIVSEDADMLTLTDDAAGLIEFENGDTIDFQNIDQIGF
ncbi:MAG: LamG-like jellyroll fold domain-containing protein [Pseudomonadota bacterium]